MATWRIGIVGAASLAGKELGTALRERRFPALAPRLFDAPGTSPAAVPEARSLVAFDDEAAVLEPFNAAALDDLDALFLAGSAEEARRCWTLARNACCLVVDLTSSLGEEPGAALAGLDPAAEDDEAGDAEARLWVVAHPGAQALAHLLRLAARAGRITAATATLFEPASERGLDGIQELEQQTVKMLSLQSLPERVYDAQVAFNLRASLGEAARPTLAELRARIARQTAELLGDAGPAPAIELLQAPLFHASVLSLHLAFAADADAEGGGIESRLAAALASPWIEAAAAYPDALAAAGEDAIQLGPPRADAAGGAWLFATLDNLRRTAFAAVDAAAAALEARGRA